jgi:lysophospholipase L1-like esterase
MSRPAPPWAHLGRSVALTLAGLVILAIGVAVWQGRRTPKGTPDYVALGSSFAAGADLGRLEKGSPLLCARSVNGYPQVLARMRGFSIVDMSCGGAVTQHLLVGGQYFQGPQIRVIDARTRWVTITVGGNDIGYIGDLGLLAMRGTHGPVGWLARTFWKGPKPVAQRDFAGVGSALLATLKAIHARAPHATIIVATYPTILPPSGTCATLGFSAAEADVMRQVGDQLAATTRSAAAQGGAILVDMNALGAGHNACSAEPWTRGYANAGAAPFHPTLAGAKATAEAVSNAVNASTGGPQD